MSKVFNEWIDKCPIDFTVVKLNGKDAYLFGKKTDMEIEIEKHEEQNSYNLAGARVDSITFWSIIDVKGCGWESCKNDKGGLDYFVEAYDLLED